MYAASSACGAGGEPGDGGAEKLVGQRSRRVHGGVPGCGFDRRHPAGPRGPWRGRPASGRVVPGQLRVEFGHGSLAVGGQRLPEPPAQFRVHGRARRSPCCRPGCPRSRPAAGCRSRPTAASVLAHASCWSRARLRRLHLPPCRGDGSFRRAGAAGRGHVPFHRRRGVAQNVLAARRFPVSAGAKRCTASTYSRGREQPASRAMFHSAGPAQGPGHAGRLSRSSEDSTVASGSAGPSRTLA